MEGYDKMELEVLISYLNSDEGFGLLKKGPPSVREIERELESEFRRKHNTLVMKEKFRDEFENKLIERAKKALRKYEARQIVLEELGNFGDTREEIFRNFLSFVESHPETRESYFEMINDKSGQSKKKTHRFWSLHPPIYKKIKREETDAKYLNLLGLMN
jgi:hypothetical protein